MKELTGGLWLGALGAGVMLGIVPGVILFLLGGLCASCELVRDKQAEQRAKNWRKKYPPYGY